MEVNYTVYVLYSEKFDRIYIGFSTDPEKRLLSHNIFATKGHTIRYRPWKIIHQECFTTKAEAMKREKQLKSAQGRTFIRSLITR